MISFLTNLTAIILFLSTSTRSRCECIGIIENNNLLDVESHVEGDEFEAGIVPGLNVFDPFYKREALR